MSNNTNTTNIPIKEKKQYDIHERIYKFIVRVIKLINSLPKTQSNLIISNQIIRSVTSMGANDQEADVTLTKKDFVHAFNIVRKENKETNFWINLIIDTNSVSIQKEASEILQEGKEIVAIVSTIINKTRVR